MKYACVVYVDEKQLGAFPKSELDAILAVVMGGTLMAGGRFSLLASIIGALVIWTFTLSMYTLGVPANALLAGRAVLVLIVILLYSDQARRMLITLFERKERAAPRAEEHAAVAPDVE